MKNKISEIKNLWVYEAYDFTYAGIVLADTKEEAFEKVAAMFDDYDEDEDEDEIYIYKVTEYENYNPNSSVLEIKYSP